MVVLGLMTGTSMDGIDLCLADLEFREIDSLKFKIIDSITYQYPNQIKKNIIKSLNNSSYNYSDLSNQIGKFYLDKTIQFLKNRNIDLIASHGQTISHLSNKYSLQIGNPEYMSKYFSIPVVYNFRKKDIDFNGTGAPLVPYLDWLLFKNSKENVFTINLGGISNLTFIPRGGIRKNIIGFDMGPGMCLSDQYMRIFFNKKYDYFGRLSSKGKVIEKLLDKLMNNEFIYKKPPKSTSVENFNEDYMIEMLKEFNQINKFDILRTLVNFTCRCIERNINLFTSLNNNKDKIFLSGGGAKNITLVNDLKEMISPNIENFNYNGINVDNKEAFLMCLLGYTCFMKIPNNISSVTGASKEVVCGEIYE